MPHNKFVEEVELHGHVIDSLLLPKVLDTILTHGGAYVIKDIKIGQRQADASHVRVEVSADSAEQLDELLDLIHDHGAVPVHAANCQTVAADVAGAFPDGFYCTTNFRTQIRLAGEWIEVEDQEMDCGIIVDPEGTAARCIAMTSVNLSDAIVVGRQGIRVFPPEAQKRTELFEFMSSAVSSEKPKGVTVREIAAAMKRTKAANEKILAVLGPRSSTPAAASGSAGSFATATCKFCSPATRWRRTTWNKQSTARAWAFRLNAACPRPRGTNIICAPSTAFDASAASPTPWRRANY